MNASVLDGSVLINQRTVKAAVSYLQARRVNPAARVELTFGEIFDLLYLIDLYVVCPHIYFDGTLPSSDVTRLKEELGYLALHGLDSDCFQFASFSRDKIVEGVAQAAGQAYASIKAMSVIGGLDQPLREEETRALDRQIDVIRAEAASASSRADVTIVAAQIIDSDIRGAKMLAGLTTLGSTLLDDLLGAYTGERRALLYGLLINRFRFFYLRQIGFQNRNIYSPGDRWEPLSKHQSILFYNFLRRQFSEGLTSTVSDGLLDAYRLNGKPLQAPFPPIGLFALLTSSGTSMRPLLERATQLRSEYAPLRGFLARTTVEAIDQERGGLIQFTNDEQLNLLIDRINAKFRDVFRSLERSRMYGSASGSGFKVVKYSVPIVAGLTVGAVATSVFGFAGSIGAAAGVIAGEIASTAVKQSTSDYLQSYVHAAADQYRQFFFALFQDPTVRADFAAKVEEYLNCKVVAERGA